MKDAEDDYTLIPSVLDRARLVDLKVDGRMESENGTWIVCRYPPIPQKGWRWNEYVLIVNHKELPPMPGLHEFKTLSSLQTFLRQLDTQRKPTNH